MINTETQRHEVIKVRPSVAQATADQKKEVDFCELAPKNLPLSSDQALRALAYQVQPISASWCRCAEIIQKIFCEDYFSGKSTI